MALNWLCRLVNTLCWVIFLGLTIHKARGGKCYGGSGGCNPATIAEANALCFMVKDIYNTAWFQTNFPSWYCSNGAYNGCKNGVSPCGGKPPGGDSGAGCTLGDCWEAVVVKNEVLSIVDFKLETLPALTQSYEFYLSPLSALTKLTKLDIAGYSFQGMIPTTISAISSTLTYLDLSSNSFYGTIPKQLSVLTKLATLYLNSNQFTGPFGSHQSICSLSQISNGKLKANNNLFCCYSSCIVPKSSETGLVPMGDVCTFPTSQPSGQPTQQPSTQPTRQPTTQPTYQPTKQPSAQPLSRPTSQPSNPPTQQPSNQPLSAPSMRPTCPPTQQPSSQPMGQPSSQPSCQPMSLPSSQPSYQPTTQPTRQPFSQPSNQPTNQPTSQPTNQPISWPSMQPSSQPSFEPSSQPSVQPSMQPSFQPSSQPSQQPIRRPSSQPSYQPTSHPSCQPTYRPTSQPSKQPSRQPSRQPSIQPTSQPMRKPSTMPTSQPSRQPTCLPTSQPTIQETERPISHPSTQPSAYPSRQPSCQPTSQPSIQPLQKPTMQPSRQPSTQPSKQPTKQPTSCPTLKPTKNPFSNPSSQPTKQPYNRPSRQPSSQPSCQPFQQPSLQPSSRPSSQPTIQPTGQPTMLPLLYPTVQPSNKPSCKPISQPSNEPSQQPTQQPLSKPSMQPTRRPSKQPFSQPTSIPSLLPTQQPSTSPSQRPTRRPSCQPSPQPSRQPTTQPFNRPTMQPTTAPSNQPTFQPFSRPSIHPSAQPSMQPSRQPSAQPISRPTTQPTRQPSTQPTMQPYMQPSCKPSRQPTRKPSNQPSTQPSISPTDAPITSRPTRPGDTNWPTSRPTSSRPTRQPISRPSTQPTRQPSCQPTGQPSSQPTRQPTMQPSSQPSSCPSKPSSQPSRCPTRQPTAQPTMQPIFQPSSQPTYQPSSLPSSQPSTKPSSQPSSQPSRYPSAQPSTRPSIQPTSQPSNPSSQPSMRPSTQPSSAPSDSARVFSNLWTIEVTRFDDFFNPAHLTDVSSFDWDYYCTNRNWRTSGPAMNCTLRLALYYCLFRMPWDNSRVSCQILLPPHSTLRLNSEFLFNEDRFPNALSKRIIVNFQSSSFTVSDAVSFFFGHKGKSVDITLMNILFDQSSNTSLMSSSKVLITEVNKVTVKDCTFDGASLEVSKSNEVIIEGSVIREVLGRRAVRLVRINNATISRVTFYNNSNGGALLVDGCGVLSVIFSSFIQNNAAYGSSLFLHRTPTSQITHSHFVSNDADVAGTVHWNFGYMPAPNMTSNIWRNNTARYYGNDVSSSFCGEVCLRVSPASILYTDYTNISLPSLIQVSVIDYYGSLMRSYNSQVKIYANQEKSSCRGVIGSSVIGHDAFVVDKVNNAHFKVFDLKRGESILSDVGVICLPSGYMTVTIEVDLNIPSDVIGIDKVVPYYLEVPISFRNCKRGEIFDVASITQSTCSLCEQSYYSLEANTDFRSVATACNVCPNNANFCSGNQIILKPGTWRMDPETMEIFTCPSVNACLGGNLTGDASCREGHIGPMCGLCEQDYFLSSDDICESCKVLTTSLLVAASVYTALLGIVGAIYWKFSVVIDEYLFDEFFQAVLGKLVSMYQIILLSSGNSSEFKSFKLYFQLANKFRFLNLDIGSMFSLSCFLQYNFYTSLQMYVLAPVSFGFLIVMKAMQSKTIAERNRCYTLLVSLLYFFIPLVSSATLQTYGCVAIGSEPYLLADLSIICKGDSYEYYKQWALFGFCLYMLVFPLYSGYVLFTRRNLIANPFIMRKFMGIMNHSDFVSMNISDYYGLLPPFEGLYARYKPLYWWYDIFNIYTSIFLTSILIALLRYELHRILASILLIVAYYIIESNTNPYKNEMENRFSYYTTFQLALLYISMYIRMNGTLGLKESYYQKLDMLMAFLQVIVLLLAVYYIVIHFRNKRNEALRSTADGIKLDVIRPLSHTIDEENIPVQVDDSKGELYKSFYGQSTVIEVASNINLTHLLRVQGVLFLRLAPLGTYESLRKRCSDVGNIINTLHYSRELPSSFIFPSKRVHSTIGDLTIFAHGRPCKENNVWISMQAGLEGFLVNAGLWLGYGGARQRELNIQLIKEAETDNNITALPAVIDMSNVDAEEKYVEESKYSSNNIYLSSAEHRSAEAIAEPNLNNSLLDSTKRAVDEPLFTVSSNESSNFSDDFYLSSDDDGIASESSEKPAVDKDSVKVMSIELSKIDEHKKGEFSDDDYDNDSDDGVIYDNSDDINVENKKNAVELLSDVNIAQTDNNDNNKEELDKNSNALDRSSSNGSIVSLYHSYSD